MHTPGFDEQLLAPHLHTVPPVPPVLAFMQQHAGLDNHEAYGTLNMGAGFALYVAPQDAAACVDAAREQGVDAWVAGTVRSGPKQVVIEPLGVTFGGDELQLR